MICILFIFALTISGTVCDEDTTEISKNTSEECRESNGFPMTEVPGKDELLKKCPSEVEYFRCLIKKMERKGDEESSLSYVRKVYQFFQDICNPESDDHKAYLRSVECYKSMQEEGKSCFSRAKDVYKAHHTLINHDAPEDVDGDWIEIEAMCMVQSVTVACLSDEVLKKCGPKAYSTMVEMVVKSHYLRQYCSPDKKAVFRTSLLDILKLDKETKKVYKSLFDVMKK